MNGRLDPLRARAREIAPARVDLLLFALVLIEGMVEALLADATLGARLAAAGPLLAVAAAIPLRRRDPILGVAVGGAGVAAAGLLREPVWEALLGIFVAWIFLNYQMAIRTHGRRLAVGVGVSLTWAVAMVVVAPAGEASELVPAVGIFVVAPVLAGRVLHDRWQLSRALAERAEALAGHDAREAEDALTAERARIAGELHDVVAHALGAMTVQAGAARRLAVRDAARAGEAFEAIELTGREALGELRTLLSVLRDEDDAAPELQPQPGLEALGEVLARARSAGLDVEVGVAGHRPETLAASVDLTAYRVVQEALSVAAGEGGARSARVVIRYGDGELAIAVTDDGPGTGGRQLLGLRERVRLYGGTVDAGPERAGGHAVRATLPLERDGVPA